VGRSSSSPVVAGTSLDDPVMVVSFMEESRGRRTRRFGPSAASVAAALLEETDVAVAPRASASGQKGAGGPVKAKSKSGGNGGGGGGGGGGGAPTYHYHGRVKHDRTPDGVRRTSPGRVTSTDAVASRGGSLTSSSRPSAAAAPRSPNPSRPARSPSRDDALRLSGSAERRSGRRSPPRSTSRLVPEEQGRLSDETSTGSRS
jgi:hypothetical protein